MTHRWSFYDPQTTTTHTLPINPKDGALPDRAKSYEAQRSTQNAVVVFEGTSPVPTLRVSGYLQTEAHHDFFNAWMDLEYAVKITDDLGQVWWAWMTKFTPVRRVRTKFKWSATYDIEFLFLRWDS